MKEEIVKFLKDKEEFTSINGFLKQYITVSRRPHSRETVADLKTKLSALVASGDIEVEGDAHLMLDALSGIQEVSKNGLALPTKYFSLEDVVVKARLTN